MQWKCPACQTEIRHDGEMPQVGRVYRCHVCHLELTLDVERNKLTLAPLSPEKDYRSTDRKG
jgi:DNA-directed RNA polymerase subunit RPC12/RpoP